MGRKCSVFGCKSGYKNQKSVTVYKFPKDLETRQSWVSRLPNKLSIDDVTDHMGVCAEHWPKDAPMVRTAGRYHVPAEPPSIFTGVPASCIPTNSATKARPTSKATQDARVKNVDEMTEFQQMDSFNCKTFYNSFCEKIALHGLH